MGLSYFQPPTSFLGCLKTSKNCFERSSGLSRSINRSVCVEMESETGRRCCAWSEKASSHRVREATQRKSFCSQSRCKSQVCQWDHIQEWLSKLCPREQSLGLGKGQRSPRSLLKVAGLGWAVSGDGGLWHQLMERGSLWCTKSL